MSAASSTKVAPQAVMHHSPAVVQKSIAAAIQNTPGRRPCATGDGGGAAIARGRLLHPARAGTPRQTSGAPRGGGGPERSRQADAPARLQGGGQRQQTDQRDVGDGGRDVGLSQADG